MKGRMLFAGLLVVPLVASGCQSPSRRAALAASEPSLVAQGESGTNTNVVQVPPARVVTFADRHPLLYKPREYYDSAGENKAAKIAAATVVGIPAGIVGELRQIVVGAPANPTY